MVGQITTAEQMGPKIPTVELMELKTSKMEQMSTTAEQKGPKTPRVELMELKTTSAVLMA